MGWWPILGDTNRTWSNQFNPHCWIFRKSRFVSRTSKSFDVVWKLICWLLFFISAPPIQIAFLNIQLYTVTLLHWQVAVYLYLCLGYNLYCFLFGLISLLSQDDVLSWITSILPHNCSTVCKAFILMIFWFQHIPFTRTRSSKQSLAVSLLTLPTVPIKKKMELKCQIHIRRNSNLSMLWILCGQSFATSTQTIKWYHLLVVSKCMIDWKTEWKKNTKRQNSYTYHL